MEENKKGTVFTSASFGYDPALVTVEVDLRRGIPAVDIVGLADGTVKASRERTIAAIKNSGEEFPPERVLISLSPADIRKESSVDLPVALAVLNENYAKNKGQPLLKENCFAIGELELNGNIRPVNDAYNSALLAKKNNITNFICNETNYAEIREIKGLNFYVADNLSSIKENLINNIKKEESVQNKKNNKSEIQFNEDGKEIWNNSFPEKTTKKLKNIRQMAVAIAGKHNIELIGAPGSGRTLITQTMIQAFTPNLTEDEAVSVKRIQSLAGYGKYQSSEENSLKAPIRMPHQTSTIEGICGGGPNCRPGEISLAHNGVLFLDEAAEFRSSVLQMLRVPLESKQITLSRAGRTTSFPANFQLAMAVNPCPCGCYGSHDKVCLCSSKSIELYHKKFSAPLTDRIEIKGITSNDSEEQRMPSYEEIKGWIENAYKIQRQEGTYNKNLSPKEVDDIIRTSPKEVQEYLEAIVNKNDFSMRQNSSAIKVAKTIANMDGRTEINLNDIKESVSYVHNGFNYNYMELVDDNSYTFQIDKGDETLDKKIDELKEQKAFLEEASKNFTESVINVSENGSNKKETDLSDSLKLVILDKKLTDGLSEQQIKAVTDSTVEQCKAFKEANKNSSIIETIKKDYSYSSTEIKIHKMFDELFNSEEHNPDKLSPQDYVDKVVTATGRNSDKDGLSWSKYAVDHAINSGGSLWKSTDDRIDDMVKHGLITAEKAEKEHENIDKIYGKYLHSYLRDCTNLDSLAVEKTHSAGKKR